MAKLGPTRTSQAERVHGSDSISFCEKSYQQVNSEINFAETKNHLWVSLGGANARERLFFDEHSLWMQDLLLKIEKLCKEPCIENILTHVNQEINMLGSVSDPKKLNDFLNSQQKNAAGHIDVEMSALLDEKILVCRHKALIAASLLGSLAKKNILPSRIVRLYRTICIQNGLSAGSHAYAVLYEKENNHLWICDPEWRQAIKVNDLVFTPTLKKYGIDAILEMIKRLELLNKPPAIKNVVANMTPSTLVAFNLFSKTLAENFVIKLQELDPEDPHQKLIEKLADPNNRDKLKAFVLSYAEPNASDLVNYAPPFKRIKN